MSDSESINFLNRWKKHMDMEWFNISIVTALSVLSFIATYRGFSVFFSEDDQEFINIVIAFIFTLVIQAGILYAVWNIKGNRWIDIPFWVAVYILCVFLSVGFGYAFWFEKIRVHDLSNELAQKSEMIIREPIDGFVSQYSDIVRIFRKISDESSKFAIEESEQGGTCYPGVPAGKGQMANYRLKDAELFRKLNRRIQNKVESLKISLDSNLGSGLFQIPAPQRKRVLNKLIAELRLKFNPQKYISNLINEIESQIHTAESEVQSIVIDDGIKRQMRVKLCAPDAQLKRDYLEEIQEMGIPEIPNMSQIVLIDSTNPRESLNYAFGGLIHKLFNFFGFESPLSESTKNLYQQNTADMVPLGLGFIVDGFILLFSRRMNPRQVEAERRIRALGEIYSGLLDHLSSLFPGQSNLWLINLLDSIALADERWWVKQKKLLVIRQNSGDKDMHRLQDFFDRLNHHKLCNLYSDRLFRALPKNYQRYVFSSIKDPGHRHQQIQGIYNVFSIDSEILTDIKTELRNRASSTTTSAASPRGNIP